MRSINLKHRTNLQAFTYNIYNHTNYLLAFTSTTLPHSSYSNMHSPTLNSILLCVTVLAASAAADCWDRKCSIDGLGTFACSYACGKKGYKHSGYETYTKGGWPPRANTGMLHDRSQTRLFPRNPMRGEITDSFLRERNFSFVVCTCGTYHSNNCGTCKNRGTPCRSRKAESNDFYAGRVPKC